VRLGTTKPLESYKVISIGEIFDECFGELEVDALVSFNVNCERANWLRRTILAGFIDVPCC
jgi:hypothetical protein